MNAKREKTGGRKRGVPNKLTANIRESLKAFMEAQRPEVEKAFKKLSPKEKVYAYSRFLPYVTPAYQSISFDLNNMSEEDLSIIENHLRKKYSHEQQETAED